MEEQICIKGGAVQHNNPEHVSMNNTLFLRSVVSGDSDTMPINGGTVTINSIKCVGNHATRGGGCLFIDSVTLTLSDSEISENVAVHGFGAGVFASYSRIQVGFVPLLANILYCHDYIYKNDVMNIVPMLATS